ncbi:retropepsin-like aspartic protease family protein [Winogradskyella thalassocola]|uniref:Aspartyl protease family protein n=1 Tax=Winogradskyella thalassocola TaxID=262004 RepID=A0A1G8B9M2_9FLAO|nr:retropepsin-like aspartic protease [Winogradskyella thalassocola]SDH29794.1 aspartyl protease family protein [Winogradskyella thalassocola]
MNKSKLLIFVLFSLIFSCKRATSSSDLNPNSTRTYNRSDIKSENMVEMKKEGGVFYIPIQINDIDMDIIFDTGASNISISETEVLFLLKQGKLNEEDFLGKVQFQDATGNISEGTRLNLKKVKIGTKTIYNVEASVVHNLEAPLLLGQSALSKFGKLTIDYNKNEIVFD